MFPSSVPTSGRLPCALLTLFALLLAGCQTSAVQTKLLAPALPDQSTDGVTLPLNKGGITYYLPMRHAKVTFDRTKADSKAIEAVTKAKDAQKEKTAALKTAEAAFTAQQDYLLALKGKGDKGFSETSEQYKTGQAELVKAGLDVVAKKKALGAADAELAVAQLGQAQYEQSQPLCGWVDSIKVTLQDPVPDTSARYELLPRHKKSRSDHFKIGTTPSGLLKSTDAELKDQTGEILINLAKSIAAAPGSSLAMRRAPSVAAAPPKCDQLNWQPRSLATVLNPTSNGDWEKISEKINDAAKVMPIKDNGATPPLTFTYALALDANPAPGAARGNAAGEDGIYYRRERPVLVKATLDSAPIGGLVLLVPNNAPIDSLDVKATAFVTNDYKIAFENGMLVSVDQTEPSEILEVVSVPWKIAKETVGIVTELIKLRVDYSTNNTALVEQQVKLTEQMKALLEAQRALDDARKSKDGTAGTDTPDVAGGGG